MLVFISGSSAHEQTEIICRKKPPDRAGTRGSQSLSVRRNPEGFLVENVFTFFLGFSLENILAQDFSSCTRAELEIQIPAQKKPPHGRGRVGVKVFCAWKPLVGVSFRECIYFLLRIFFGEHSRTGLRSPTRAPNWRFRCLPPKSPPTERGAFWWQG